MCYPLDWGQKGQFRKAPNQPSFSFVVVVVLLLFSLFLSPPQSSIRTPLFDEMKKPIGMIASLEILGLKPQLWWVFKDGLYSSQQKNPYSKPKFQTHIPFYSNWQLPQFNKIRFMTIRSWKSNLNVNNSNPPKDRIKGREKKNFNSVR